MIRLTRLNHVPLVLNSDLIEQVEVTPDTVITLTTGEKLMVLESADEIVRLVVAFRRSISDWTPSCPYAANSGGGRSAGHDAKDAEDHG
jgi:flagellar protein FlbD